MTARSISISAPETTTATPGKTDARERIVLDDNSTALLLFGQSNANLKAIEREVGLTIGVRGNELTLVGAADRVALGRSLVEQLYQMAKKGRPLALADIVARRRCARRRSARADQGCLPRHGADGVAGAADPAEGPGAEALRRRHSRATTSCSASGRPAPARPTWRWRWRCARSSTRRSSASCWRVRRSRRARSSASCPATWRRR